tara:strand:- start:23 stop:226 length:204 start_codon:yes stop_codon:yes gene_type:complete
MVCRVCKDKKMVAVPVQKITRKRNQYYEDYEVIKTNIGGIDACHFCAEEAEHQYQIFLEEEIYDRFI